jgi:hypothetical protein
VREGTVGIHARALGGASLPLSERFLLRQPASTTYRLHPMIICCGEALIDMLPRADNGQANRRLRPIPAARCSTRPSRLGRLGAPVEFLTGLSSDFFRRHAAPVADSASGVGTAYAHVSARPTTLAFVRLSNGQASYLFYDEGTAGRMLTEADMPPLGPSIQAMLFGAISLIPEPCGSAYEALLRREHSTRVIMLDPNIRPGFIPDANSHRARIRRMAAMSDIVKFSDEDLGWFETPVRLKPAPALARSRREARSGDARRRWRDGVTRNDLTVEVPAQKGDCRRHGRRWRHLQRRRAGLAQRARLADQAGHRKYRPQRQIKAASTAWRSGRSRHRLARRRKPALAARELG